VSRLSRRLLGSAVALCAVVAIASAQIESFTLARMVASADDALYGEIVASRVFRVDHPVAGPELYFTTLTLKGRSLRDGRAKTVLVTYPGGVLNEREGSWNSEAPSADDAKLGNEVVIFYGHADDLGGGVSGDTLWAARGGLYRTVEGPLGPVVLGRGDGFAIPASRKLADLESAIRKLAGRSTGTPKGEKQGEKP
jgi:hypothetical protein